MLIEQSNEDVCNTRCVCITPLSNTFLTKFTYSPKYKYLKV